jgi:hypothetical protein
LSDEDRPLTVRIPPWAKLLLITALPNVMALVGVYYDGVRRDARQEERIAALEKDREADRDSAKAMKSDLQRELNGLNVMLQNVDGKITALLMAQRAQR